MVFPCAVVGVVLAWQVPAAGDAPPPAPASPSYQVVQVVSGTVLKVKGPDGATQTVQLYGVGTPKSGAESASADRLNQTNHLRSLVPVNSKVRLDVVPGKSGSDGAVSARVTRADGLEVGEAMVGQGFATVSSEATGASRDALLTAETTARAEKRGMWSPDYATQAAKPARYERAKTAKTARTKSRRQGPQRLPDFPPGGGMPALGLGQTPEPVLVPVPVATVDPNAGWLTNYGLGFGNGGAGIVYPWMFEYDQFGNRRSANDSNRLYNQYIQAQNQQNVRAQQFARTLADGIRQGQGLPPATNVPGAAPVFINQAPSQGGNPGFPGLGGQAPVPTPGGGFQGTSPRGSGGIPGTGHTGR